MEKQFKIIDKIGAADWAAKEIKELFKDSKTFNILPTGTTNGKGEYTMIFNIHPLHESDFISKWVPQMEAICKTNGVTGQCMENV